MNLIREEKTLVINKATLESKAIEVTFINTGEQVLYLTNLVGEDYVKVRDKHGNIFVLDAHRIFDENLNPDGDYRIRVLQ